jgi:hypothetical protein
MSRKKSLRKDYGCKISSGGLKSRRVAVLRSKGFSVFGKTGRNKPHFFATNLLDIGVGSSNLEVSTSCQNLQLEESPGFFS